MMWSWDEFGLRTVIRTALARRRILGLLVLVVFLALVAIVPTSLADQRWIAGFYDGDDADDVIRALSVTEATVETPEIVAKVRSRLALSPAAPATGFAEFTWFAPPYLRSPPA